MLDTNVYIDIIQDRLPAGVERLLQRRPANSSSVCLSELTHLFGRLDPGDPRTAKALESVASAIGRISSRRLTSPSVRAAGEAGILAGMLARLGGIGAGREQAMLNDALIYAHAVERGFVVLTRSIREFDLLDQLWPNGSVLFYRTA